MEILCIIYCNCSVNITLFQSNEAFKRKGKANFMGEQTSMYIRSKYINFFEISPTYLKSVLY